MITICTKEYGFAKKIYVGLIVLFALARKNTLCVYSIFAS